MTTSDLTLFLPSHRPDDLARLLRSMASSMGGADATVRHGVVVSVEVDSRARSIALLTRQGAYVVLERDYGPLFDAVLPGIQRIPQVIDLARDLFAAPPPVLASRTVEQALDLLAYLPPAALAERVALLPGEWWPADELERVESWDKRSRTFARRAEPRRMLTVLPPVRADVDTVTNAWERR